jgi:hypothetical protein
MLTLLKVNWWRGLLQALVEVNRVVGPIFFISYVCVVFFILINVFLAIINDSCVLLFNVYTRRLLVSISKLNVD